VAAESGASGKHGMSEGAEGSEMTKQRIADRSGFRGKVWFVDRAVQECAGRDYLVSSCKHGGKNAKCTRSEEQSTGSCGLLAVYSRSAPHCSESSRAGTIAQRMRQRTRISRIRGSRIARRTFEPQGEAVVMDRRHRSLRSGGVARGNRPGAATKGLRPKTALNLPSRSRPDGARASHPSQTCCGGQMIEASRSSTHVG
jgi:hypothetical protein